MAIISRGFDDIVLDRIVKALNDFAQAQIEECASASEKAAVKFTAYRDRFKPAGVNQLPMVTVWLASSSSEEKTAGAWKHPEETITINVDMLTSYVTDTTQGLPYTAAMKRMAYLKEQVRQTLYSLENSDFGFEPGVIGSKSWPRYKPYTNRSGNPEESVTGGRFVFELTYAPDQLDSTGASLTELKVDADKISAAYIYN